MRAAARHIQNDFMQRKQEIKILADEYYFGSAIRKQNKAKQLHYYIKPCDCGPESYIVCLWRTKIK